MTARTIHFAIVLSTVVWLGLAPAGRADAADARRLMTTGAMVLVPGIDDRRAAALKRKGINSLSALARADARSVQQALGIDARRAAGFVTEARRRNAGLRGVYAGNRRDFRPTKARSTRMSAYAKLVAETNECTVLVRKVCGEGNQCGGGSACTVAKQILDEYNTAADNGPAADACLAAGADETVFPRCTQP